MRTYKVTFNFTRKEFMDFIDGAGPLMDRMTLTVVDDDEPKTSAPPAPAKERKPRRTKAQMAADTPKQMMEDEAPTKPLFPWKDGEMNKTAAE